MITAFMQKIFGTKNDREVKKYFKEYNQEEMMEIFKYYKKSYNNKYDYPLYIYVIFFCHFFLFSKLKFTNYFAAFVIYFSKIARNLSLSW